MEGRKVQLRRSYQEPLDTGDSIEYSLTEEVALGGGRKAWVKFGLTSTVRNGESTADAVGRVSMFVNEGLDARINALS
jgi:hypothetical protein